MRVLMSVLAYYENDARVRRYAESLAAEGHEVEVVALRGPGKAALETIEGVLLHRVPMKRLRGGLMQTVLEYLLFFFWSTLYLTRLSLRRAPALVHVHNMPDFLIFSAFLAKLRGAKLILDVHDLMPEVFASKTKFALENPRILPFRIQEVVSQLFADRVIFATEIFRDIAIRRGCVSREQSIAVMNAADTKLFDSTKYPRKGPPDPNEFRLLYLGTITERHGVDQLVTVLPLVRERIPGIRLVIHPRLAEGEGKALEDLRTLTKELGVEDLVRFEGSLSLADVPERMSQCSVGTFTPHMDVHIDMALSLKIPEYAAMELPILTVRTRIMESLFEEGDCLYFDDGDYETFAKHLVWVHEHPDEARAMALRAKRSISKHSWTREYARYRACVMSLLGEPQAPYASAQASSPEA